MKDSRLIVALDYDALSEVKDIVQELKGLVNIYKIGYQLFLNEGPKAIKEVKRYGNKVFLDLKFHDIPNTVYRAAETVTGWGVNIFNLHTLGGRNMMRAALRATHLTSRKLKIKKPIILGVTILTSMDKQILRNELKINKNLKLMVLGLASEAQKAGLSGVIASADEVSLIKKNLGKKFLVLTPGIRLNKEKKDDQKRVVTPKEAIRCGADFIIVGREITKSSHPRKIAEKYLEEIKQGEAENFLT